MSEAQVQSEFDGLSNDISLTHGNERRVDVQLRAPLHSGLRRQVAHRLKSVYKLRPAIRITGIVDCIHADEDGRSLQNLGVCERKGQENGVSSRNVRDGDSPIHLV